MHAPPCGLRSCRMYCSDRRLLLCPQTAMPGCSLPVPVVLHVHVQQDASQQRPKHKSTTAQGHTAQQLTSCLHEVGQVGVALRRESRIMAPGNAQRSRRHCRVQQILVRARPAPAVLQGSTASGYCHLKHHMLVAAVVAGSWPHCNLCSELWQHAALRSTAEQECDDVNFKQMRQHQAVVRPVDPWSKPSTAFVLVSKGHRIDACKQVRQWEAPCRRRRCTAHAGCPARALPGCACSPAAAALPG